MALVLATLLFSFSFIPFDAQASDNILRIVQGYTRTSLYNAYEALGSNQKDICDYLVGCYNATYLGARGFKFAPGEITDASSLSQVFRMLGGKVMQNTNISLWGSRMSDVFCNYVSSCILYASEIPSRTSFNTWFNSLPEDFSIPYNKDMYDAWNNYYNDISNDGIKSFPISDAPWDSGQYYDYAFSTFAFYDNASANTYNNFIVNFSPVFFTNVGLSWSDNEIQVLISLNSYPDTLYIQRNVGYQFYRFGYYNVNSFGISGKRITPEKITSYQVFIGDRPYGEFNLTMPIVNTNSTHSLADLIQIAFNKTPLNSIGALAGRQDSLNGYYPFISHVILVDDLNTLSNPEEIFNTTGVELTGGDSVSKIPLTDLLLYIKRLETDLPFPYPATDPVPIKQIIINNTYNYNGDPSDDDDYQPAVITRVDQAYTDPISVDDGWFTSASDYIRYMWDMTKPVVEYTKDMLDVFTIDNDDGNVSGLSLVIYASVTIGVAGGVLSKLLL